MVIWEKIVLRTSPSELLCRIVRAVSIHRRWGREIKACVVPAAVWIIVAAATGCSSTRQLTESDQAQARGPLPYHTGIFLDTEKLGYHRPPEQDELAIQYVGDDAQLLEVVRAALDGSVVTLCEVLDAKTRSEARQQAEGLDLLVAIGFDSAPNFSEYDRSVGWGALEVATFLFGGIPSWFVPTVRYSTPARLRVEVLELHQPKAKTWLQGDDDDVEFDWLQEISSAGQPTSLWDRSRQGLDYALTIIAPPMLVVPGDPDHLSNSLTEGVNDELAGTASATIKDRILLHEWTSPLSVVFLSPDPNEIVVGDTMDLRLSVSAREGGSLREFNVLRVSPNADDFEWRATSRQLETLNAALAKRVDPTAGVKVRVPLPIPVVDGGNLVKVRVVHESGEDIVRTMFYVK